MPHFWCGVMKFSTICFCRWERASSITGAIGPEIDRRAVNAQGLAERQHPAMVLIELLAAGQRPPRDQLVDVGIAGVVADLLAFQPRPGRRRDDLARLGDDVAETDLLVLLRQQRQMRARGRSSCRALPRPRRPRRWSREPASAAPRRHRCGLDAARPWPDHRRRRRSGGALRLLDLVLGLPGDALDAVADLLHQRPERREALVGWDSRARRR